MTHRVDLHTTSWSHYPREAKQLTALIEQKLLSLQRLGEGGKDGCQALKEEIEEHFEQLRALNDSVPEDNLPRSDRLRLERNRELYNENKADFERVLKNVETHKQRTELLGNVQSSILEYSEAHQALNREADDIANARRSLEAVYAQATSGHETLIHTQNMLDRAGNRIRELGTKIPAIHSLLNSINRKYRRDHIIVGTLIGFLVFVTWLFW
ncbi:Golgi SNAP receptor complex member 1-2 [Diplonema papillatum]|nr:Golgi SNAP receptor complex member 1-2 [Diplonema papillatum]